MILMYHKIAPDSPTIWWVTVDDFYRQLCELQSKTLVYLDDYDPANPDHVVITFDGVYENIFKYALPLLKKFKYPFELFFSGDYVGKDNSFDKVDKRTGLPTNEPTALFADKKQLRALVLGGGRLQWHTASHENLVTLDSDVSIQKELKIPKEYEKLDSTGLNWFAYPHGEFNKQTLELVKKQFSGAVSVIQGNDTDKWILNRITVINESTFAQEKIAIIIPCYNYGSFLVEAIESVLKQTRQANEILIIDDASIDNTEEIGKLYAQEYPALVRFVHNKKNLGIVKTFNKAVNLVSAEYICFLGADNRFLSNYLEETTKILDKNQKIAVAYTDFALFGPRASTTFDTIQPERRGKILNEYYYQVHFPNFTKEIADKLKKENFMHGSSLYRKSVFNKVGGYQDSASAEDHNLFYRMITAGWQAQRVPKVLLEYRQHSLEQVNTKLNSFAELTFYQRQYRVAQNELDKIHNSKFWKLLFLYKHPKRALKQYLPKVLKTVLS